MRLLERDVMRFYVLRCYQTLAKRVVAFTIILFNLVKRLNVVWVLGEINVIFKRPENCLAD